MSAGTAIRQHMGQLSQQQPNQQPPQRTLIRCTHCGTVLAETDGPVLYVSLVCRVVYSVVLNCVCGGERTWKPLDDSEIFRKGRVGK